MYNCLIVFYTRLEELMAVQLLGQLDLSLSDSPQLSGRTGFPGYFANGDVCSASEGALGGDPVTDFFWYNFNDRNARVFLVSVVDSVFQVAEICGYRGRPMFVDQLLVLGYSGCAGIGCPARRIRIAKADVNVRVVLNFVEFRRRVVREEDEGELSVGEGRRRDHGTGMEMTIGAVGGEHASSGGFENFMETSNFFLGTEACIFSVRGIGIKGSGGHLFRFVFLASVV